MVVRHQSLRDVTSIYDGNTIDLVMRGKGVLLVDKYSPKLQMSHLCPSLDGRFYTSKGYLYLWNCVWVNNKDVPEALTFEMNKRYFF